MERGCHRQSTNEERTYFKRRGGSVLWLYAGINPESIQQIQPARKRPTRGGRPGKKKGHLKVSATDKINHGKQINSEGGGGGSGGGGGGGGGGEWGGGGGKGNSKGGERKKGKKWGKAGGEGEDRGKGGGKRKRVGIKVRSPYFSKRGHLFHHSNEGRRLQGFKK